MDPKHTPGEWKAEINGDITVEGKVIACAFKSHHDAQLMAAAKDLLEALVDFGRWANIKDGSQSQYLRDKAHKAIKKASGR